MQQVIQIYLSPSDGILICINIHYTGALAVMTQHDFLSTYSWRYPGPVRKTQMSSPGSVRPVMQV